MRCLGRRRTLIIYQNTFHIFLFRPHSNSVSWVLLFLLWRMKNWSSDRLRNKIRGIFQVLWILVWVTPSPVLPRQYKSSLDKEGKLQSTIWPHHIYEKPPHLLELGSLPEFIYLIFQPSGNATLTLYTIGDIYYPFSKVAGYSQSEVSISEFVIKIWSMESKDKILNFPFD